MWFDECRFLFPEDGDAEELDGLVDKQLATCPTETDYLLMNSLKWEVDIPPLKKPEKWQGRGKQKMRFKK